MTLEHLKNFIKVRLGAGPTGEVARDVAANGTADGTRLQEAAKSEPLCIAVGAIDANRERCIGVYPGRPPARQRVCLGGPEATLTGELYATVLVHWGKNMREAMEKAGEVYALFYAWGSKTCSKSSADIGGTRRHAGGPVRASGEMDGVQVYAVEPGGGPVPVGRDEHGVCEFVINLKITFEKECA